MSTSLLVVTTPLYYFELRTFAIQNGIYKWLSVRENSKVYLAISYRGYASNFGWLQFFVQTFRLGSTRFALRQRNSIELSSINSVITELFLEQNRKPTQ